METNNEFRGNIEDAFVSLERISARLQQQALIIVSLTMINLSISIAITLGFFRYLYIGIPLSWLPAIESAVAILAVIISLRFDSLKKDGDAYFEELSDELHGDKISSSNIKSIGLKARVIIRRYASSASIPLVPGKYGPATLSLMNLILLFITGFMLRFY